MRAFTVILLTLVFINPVLAFELGSHDSHPKTSSHVLANQGIPDGRDGGETLADAVDITALPFSDTGNTSDNVDDYDVPCDSYSTSPDVVYSYTPAADGYISVDMCGSGYDTKVYVIDGDLNVIACNDDFYYSDPCGLCVSFFEYAHLTGGVEYFIVVDGRDGDSGDYVMEVFETDLPEPCYITIQDDECEPALTDGYIDVYNSGCNDEVLFRFPFQPLWVEIDGTATFGGNAGWFNDVNRDTDWIEATIGWDGMIEWTLDAEQVTAGCLLSPHDCEDVGVVDFISAGPCAPATMTIQGTPGDLVWLWVGAQSFEPPVTFLGHEYNYICEFTGLYPYGTATERVTLDALKSLYR